ALPAPAHLAPSLLGFPHLPLAARLRAAWVARAFASLDPDDARLDERSLGSWLAERGVRDEQSLAFWDLQIRPTLQVRAADTSHARSAGCALPPWTGPTRRTSGSQLYLSGIYTMRRRSARCALPVPPCISAQPCAARSPIRTACACRWTVRRCMPTP